MSGLVLVSGLGRCGSSLLMQMLAAGGYPIAAGARAPAFELEVNARVDIMADIRRGADPYADVRDERGALKWLDPQRFPPPPFAESMHLAANGASAIRPRATGVRCLPHLLEAELLEVERLAERDRSWAHAPRGVAAMLGRVLR